MSPRLFRRNGTRGGTREPAAADAPRRPPRRLRRSQEGSADPSGPSDRSAGRSDRNFFDEIDRRKRRATGRADESARRDPGEKAEMDGLVRWVRDGLISSIIEEVAKEQLSAPPPVWTKERR